MKSPASARAGRPWYAEAFGNDYLERYAHRDESTAQEAVPFLARALRVPRGARLLDLCCGAGRFSRPLARAGFEVLGVDLSLDLLRHAGKARSAAVLLRADMRALPLAGDAFDGVVNLFTSFGYFERDEENRAALAEAVRVLKPGGVLLLDFLNLAPTVANLAPETRRPLGGELLIERRRYDPRRRRLEKIIRVEDRASGARKRELTESLRAYAPDELAALFREAGLALRERFGDLRGAPFDAQRSPRCVSVGQK